ncbi:MAG: GntR family transcriptional regulator [Actinobacteria bacterium]|nr:GntR family transcriptional regulator [Actinomycetota bacterium]
MAGNHAALRIGMTAARRPHQTYGAPAARIDGVASIDQLPPSGQSALPLWLQVVEVLRAHSAKLTGERETRLPTEADLARHLGVSVSTVRQALAALERDGLVTRRRRRGTFLAGSPATEHTLLLAGSLESIVRQQQSTDTVVLGRASRRPPPELDAHFADAGAVTCIERLRSEQGRPVSYAENFLRPALARRVTNARLAAAPVTQVLRDNLDLRLSHIENVIEARPAPPRVASLLEMELREPVLLSTNLTYDAGGRVVDAALIYYRGDRFRFGVRIDIG